MPLLSILSFPRNAKDWKFMYVIIDVSFHVDLFAFAVPCVLFVFYHVVHFSCSSLYALKVVLRILRLEDGSRRTRFIAQLTSLLFRICTQSPGKFFSLGFHREWENSFKEEVADQLQIAIIVEV